MPANESTSTDAIDAYTTGDASPDTDSNDEPVTISDLKSESSQAHSHGKATQDATSESSPATLATGSRDESDTTGDESPSPTRDLEAIKADILQGIGRHGDCRWYRLGSYQRPRNCFGYFLRVHLDKREWFCLVKEQPRGLTTQYTIHDLGTHLALEPVVPDLETLTTAVNAQRSQALRADQPAAVAPLSDEQRQQFEWEYGRLTRKKFRDYRLTAAREPSAEYTMYERHVLLDDYEPALRAALSDTFSSRQLDIMMNTMWNAFDAMPSVPHQLLEQTNATAPLVGRLILE